MAIVWLIVLVIVMATTLTYAWGAVKAAPYVPTRSADVDRMLRLAHIKPGELVYDLGAGDGRFLLTTARKFRARGVGFEISLLPYVIGKIRIALSGLPNVKLSYTDFFQVDLSTADVIVCFLTPMAMAKLKPKFERELKPGSRVVSYAFAVPDWTPTKKDKPQPNIMGVYLYQR